VIRDEASIWTCLGTCTPRDQAPDQPKTCTCSPTASGALPPDSQSAYHCFYGESANVDMWDGTQNGAWPSRAVFESRFGSRLSLWASEDETGYRTAKSSFLTTNCPVLKPIEVLYADPQQQNVTLSKYLYLNSCGCRKSAQSWIVYPDFK